MRARIFSALAKALAVAGLAVSATSAQQPTAPAQPVSAPASAPAAPQKYSPAQLDQMLAPIALYPDELVSHILIASTYPLEVVEADRWLQDPDNAQLAGDQLNEVLKDSPWDPSVKSLVPFPQILKMMDTHLEWTETLGDAFLADQAGVMDSIQRLRQRAQTAGDLRTTSQEIVTNDNGDIDIAPPTADYVYVPVCDPGIVYGAWPYPDYPPDYFTGFYSGLPVGAFGCGWWGEPIILPLWGWSTWDWHHHRLGIDRGRYTNLNGNRPPVGSGTTWQHDPSHRQSVPYGDPALRNRFGAGAGNTEDINRASRGFPTESQPPEEPRVSPTFESFDSGSSARHDFDRGYSSRSSMPSGGGRISAPSGFGGGRPHR